MGVLKPWHILVLVAVLILLFGAKRLPGAARSLGRSLRIIKAETRGLVDEPEPDDLDEKADAQAARQPLSRSTEPRSTETKPATGEVVDPPERVRDSR
jgi:sec-independent protein translocase protein TatA